MMRRDIPQNGPRSEEVGRLGAKGSWSKGGVRERRWALYSLGVVFLAVSVALRGPRAGAR